MYFQSSTFWWKPFYMPVRKWNQKGWRVSNFALSLVIFKWHHGSDGVKCCTIKFRLGTFLVYINIQINCARQCVCVLYLPSPHLPHPHPPPLHSPLPLLMWNMTTWTYQPDWPCMWKIFKFSVLFLWALRASFSALQIYVISSSSSSSNYSSLLYSAILCSHVVPNEWLNPFCSAYF